MTRIAFIPVRQLSTSAGLCALIALVSILAGANAQQTKFATSGAKNVSLNESMKSILGRAEFKGAVVGVHVVRISDGTELFSRDSNRLLIPASNTKLFTTAAAIHLLGPDFQFRTIVGTAGRDLVVVGGGDPTIGGRFTDGDPTVYFRRWAQLLKDQGISRIAGDLVIDDSYFDRTYVHPNWKSTDLGRWYAAPVAALVFNDSCVDVRVEPGPKPDAPAAVSVVPNTKLFELSNRTRTVSSTKAHAPRVIRAPGSNIIQYEGGVYARAAPINTWLAVDNPVLYFGTVMREILAVEGITVAGTIRQTSESGRSPNFQPRLSHRFSLLPAIEVTNKESQNLYAEQILKTLGAIHGEGTWDRGRRAAVEALEQLGLQSDDFVIDDGCGLSRANRASPRAFTSLLVTMHRGLYGEAFRDSLSIAGVDGTLENRLTSDPYRGRIWAKTGSISGVRAISGYVHTRAGEWLAFSLLVNNARFSVRAAQEDFCKALVDWRDGRSVVRKEPAGRKER